MTIQRIITADKLVTIETSVEDREIDFNDILDCVKVDPDDEYRNPFEDSDCYAHTLTKEHWNENTERVKHANNRVYTDRCRGVGFIEPADLITTTVKYWRNLGASRQVAFELVARERQTLIDQIQSIYNNGVEYYYVHGEYKGCSDGVGGVDGYDYATGECRREVAENIACELEGEGHIITNKPDASAERRQAKIYNLKYRQNMFNWK